MLESADSTDRAWRVGFGARLCFRRRPVRTAAANAKRTSPVSPAARPLTSSAETPRARARGPRGVRSARPRDGRNC